MITKEQVTALVAEQIDGTDMFVVEISVRPGNKVEVLLDADSGVTIEHCTDVHRHLVKAFEEAEEDFEMQVSSPGVGQPLRVKRQYFKNVGRSIKVKTTEGGKAEGLLKNATEDGIEVEFEAREEIPGKKGKKKVVKTETIAFHHIAEAKIVITFK